MANIIWKGHAWPSVAEGYLGNQLVVTIVYRGGIRPGPNDYQMEYLLPPKTTETFACLTAAKKHAEYWARGFLLRSQLRQMKAKGGVDIPNPVTVFNYTLMRVANKGLRTIPVSHAVVDGLWDMQDPEHYNEVVRLLQQRHTNGWKVTEVVKAIQ